MKKSKKWKRNDFLMDHINVQNNFPVQDMRGEYFTFDDFDCAEGFEKHIREKTLPSEKQLKLASTLGIKLSHDENLTRAKLAKLISKQLENNFVIFIKAREISVGRMIEILECPYQDIIGEVIKINKKEQTIAIKTKNKQYCRRGWMSFRPQKYKFKLL